jgi:hypothetical protein
MSYRPSSVLRALVVGGVLMASPALAVISSSCPAPCAKPPKSALFMRETNDLDANSYTVPLSGMLSRGSAHTVVRVDATFMVPNRGTMSTVEVYPVLNGRFQDLSSTGVINACSTTHPTCSVTGTFWFDVDELEATYPGTFVGQPLNLAVVGNPLTGSAAGFTYHLSFSAQVVKKK